MNALGAMLKTPWIASPRSSRWLGVIVGLLCAAATVAAMHGLQGRDALMIGAMAWSAAISCWCLLVAGNALFLARDATVLCLPSLRRITNASVVVHAVLFVLLPALLLGALAGHALFWLIAFSLAAAVCMLFLLLPSALTVAVIMGASLGLQLWHPQLPAKHVLLDLAIAPTALLVALAAWQWLRLQRRAAPVSFGYKVPMIWSLRLQQIHGFGALRADPDKLMARASSSWFTPVPDLASIGPAQPVRSIRVALGRNAMPQTWTSVARQVALSLTIVVLFSGLPLAAQMGNHDFRVLMAAMFLPHAGSLGMPVIIACVLAALAALVFPASVRARWAAGAAELPLLALLPGLGDAANARRHVLRAALTQTVRAAAIEFVILCVLAIWSGAVPNGIVFAVLGVACTAALAAACILGVLAARPLSQWLVGPLTGVLLLVVGLAMAVGFGRAGGFGASATLPLAGALLVLLAILLALCRRGWRTFARRAHPFLVGTP